MWDILFLINVISILFILFHAIVYKKKYNDRVFFICSLFSYILLTFYNNSDKKVLAVLYILYATTYITECMKITGEKK